jgi:thiamine pyrophosphokinase
VGWLRQPTTLLNTLQVSMMSTAIFANGTISTPEIYLPPETFIIAADGGAKHCLKLKLTPQVVIGDFDSLTTNEIAALEEAGAKLIQHPTAKDETDLELALEHALKLGASEITLYGLLGGRWDMTFANLLLLAAPHYAGIRFRIVDGETQVFILRGGEKLEIHGQPGDIVSTIPLSNEAHGVTYQGLEWPLVDATLHFGTTRGVSNVLVSSPATISINEGLLLCFKSANHPHP